MIFTTIDGSLPDNMQLIYPLVIQIQDDEEVLISEHNFYIHASGPTVAEAIEEFKRVLVDELNELIPNEIHLGPRSQKQLRYLRSTIKRTDENKR